ncbi:MAG: GNAT family N-acetyltransferase [Anaerocolumna sp.]
MNILQLHKLNKRQIKDTVDLVQKCLKEDGLERTLYLDNDINFHVNLDSFYLIYDGRRMVSVLTIFEPLADEAEITAYTLPSERRKGFFKVLFNKALKELIRFEVYRILFVAEPKSVNGLAALKACKTKYFKSEYLLSFQFNEDVIKELEPGIILKEILRDKQNEAAALSSEIFCTDIEETKDVIEISMNSKYMKCFGAYIEDGLIGICNISYGADQASIFGFGIAPAFQGNGYGRLFLDQAMNIIYKKGIKSITLHVGSGNKRAFNLYTSIGFTIQTQYDYYEYIIPVRE